MKQKIENRIEKYLKKHPAASEYRFLFECCRVAFAEITIQYPDNIRPKIFLEIVQHHKLIPHLYPILKNRCKNVSEEVLQGFQQLLRQHHLHILKLSGELARISKLFAAQSIPWLSIKGPALSVQLYGDIAARQSGDLDILVNENNLTRAISILMQLGYEMIVPAKKLDVKHDEKYRKRFKDYLFQHKERKDLVELHWMLSYDWFTPDNITSLLWQQLEKVVIANEKISVPNAANHLIFLYEHGSRHSWYRLAWLWDIAYATKNGFGKNMDKAILSKELNSCFMAADDLCSDIFGIEMHFTRRDSKKIKKMVHLSKKSLVVPEKTKSLRMSWLRLKYMLYLHSGLIGKMRCLKRYCKFGYN